MIAAVSDGLQYRCPCGDLITLPMVEPVTRGILELAHDLDILVQDHKRVHLQRIFAKAEEIGRAMDGASQASDAARRRALTFDEPHSPQASREHTFYCVCTRLLVHSIHGVSRASAGEADSHRPPATR